MPFPPKWIKVALLVFVLIGIGLGTFQELSQKRDAFDKPPTNLQVLEVEHPSELRPIMRNFGQSLGVGCDFCHNTEDWAEDVPHKEIAREMIKMVRQINADVFTAELFTWEDDVPRATCNMCHNGHAHPQFKPSDPDEEE